MSALSRRTLLQGTATAVLVASVAALPEIASATPAVDPVLVLKAEYDRLEAEQVLAEAEEKRILATLPEDVLRAPQAQLPAYRVGDRTITPKPLIFKDEDGIHALTRGERNADAAAARLVALWRADRDRIDAARDAAGLTAAEQRADRLAEQAYAVGEELWRGAVSDASHHARRAGRPGRASAG